MSASEPRQVGKTRLAAMNMHAAQLGAAVQLREQLAGVEQPLRIEGAFEALLLVQVNLVEHGRHEIALLDADAMLAGENTADLDAEAQNVGAEGLRPLELALVVGVVEDERVEIPVAGVEYVGA